MVFMALRFVFADKSRLKSYSKDVLIAVFSFFALICLGMIWSEGGSEAWKQLEKSLPFLIVPLYLMNLDLQERKNLKIYSLDQRPCKLQKANALTSSVEFTVKVASATSPGLKHNRFKTKLCRINKLLECDKQS